MEPMLIAIDAGTTGVTGVLFDADLESRGRSYAEFPQGFPRPGWVEHEAHEILSAVDRVLAELFDRVEPARVAAIGITNQRETVFACDRTSGRALRPGIVWQDRRTASRCDELRAEGHSELIARKTGLLLDPYFSASKIEWMLKEDPDVARRARAGEVVFATVDALVIGHLSGFKRWVTDPTNASRTMLFALEPLQDREWDGELCRLFGVEPTWLPEVLPSVGRFAESLPARTGGRAIPVLGVAGDQQAALFGQGCFDAGSFKSTYGTGCFLLLNTGGERRSSSRGLLTTLAVGRDGSTVYALEGSVFVAGALIQWLRDQMGFFERSSDVEALAAQVEDSAGVFVVPAFAGLGAPDWDPGARGAILGLTRGAARAHVARASLEAIAFQNAELVEILREESGLRVDWLLADGGAAQNDLLMQLQADLAGLEVRRSASLEATARGAAAMAGLGASLWKDPSEAGAFQSPAGKFLPALPEPARRERLSDWRVAVERVRTNR